MFIILGVMLRYPRMYSTPPPPETEEEAAEDNTFLNLLQIPDLLTFFCIVILSILVPLRLDNHVSWSWNTTLIPMYCMFFAPLVGLLFVLPVIGWVPLRHGMVKPFNSWSYWLILLNWIVGGTIFTWILAKRMTWLTAVLPAGQAAPVVHWKPLFIPLFIMLGCSFIYGVLNGETADVIKDLFLTLPFDILLLLKLNHGTFDTWWQCFAPVFVADGFFCIYMATRPNPRFNRFGIFFGSLVMLIPLIVFQYHLVAWFEGFHDLDWVHVFIPLWVIEGMMFCPLCCCATSFIGYDGYKKYRDRKKAKKYQKVPTSEPDTPGGGNGDQPSAVEAGVAGLFGAIGSEQVSNFVGGAVSTHLEATGAPSGVAKAGGKLGAKAAGTERGQQFVQKRVAAKADEVVQQTVG